MQAVQLTCNAVRMLPGLGARSLGLETLCVCSSGSHCRAVRGYQLHAAGRAAALTCDAGLARTQKLAACARDTQVPLGVHGRRLP